MAKIFIDAEGCAMGRVASFAAKNALSGNEVFILNSEKAVISGRAEKTIDDFKLMMQLNTLKPGKGPLISKVPERIMKRAVRGMIPDYRLGRGKVAWKKVRTYRGIPEEFAKEKLIKLEKKENQLKKAMTIADLSRRA